MTKTNELNERCSSQAIQDSIRGAANSAKETAMEYGSHYVAEPAKDIVKLFQVYAKARPEVAAAWCFGLGVILGWKLRP